MTTTPAHETDYAPKSNAWIVKYREDKQYLYIGRADGSDKALVRIHKNGLEFWYDVKYGGKHKPVVRYPRKRIIPGEYSLNAIVKHLIHCTGYNHDYEEFRLNAANRTSRIIDGLTKSKIWEQRGKLNWPVNERFFKAISLKLFLENARTDYATWWTRYLTKTHRWAQNRTKYPRGIGQAIRRGTIPLPHLLELDTKIGKLCFERENAWMLENFAEYQKARDCHGDKIVAFVLTTPNAVNGIRALDRLEPALRSITMLQKLTEFGIERFADIPVDQIRLAMALEHLHNGAKTPIVRQVDLETLPIPPAGFTWATANEIRRFAPTRVFDTAHGVLRILKRKNDNGYIAVRWLTSKTTWQLDEEAHTGLTPRETLKLVALVENMPKTTYPIVTYTYRTLTETIANRLIRFPWAQKILDGEQPQFPFHRYNPRTTNYYVCELVNNNSWDNLF